MFFYDVCTTRGKFSSEYIKSIPVSYYGFNVFFNSPVAIRRGVEYHLEASIFLALPTLVLVKMANVLLFVHGLSSNGTKVERGQFPGGGGSVTGVLLHPPARKASPPGIKTPDNRTLPLPPSMCVSENRDYRHL